MDGVPRLPALRHLMLVNDEVLAQYYLTGEGFHMMYDYGVSRIHRDLIAVVYDQLPRTLRDELTVRVQTDAFLVRPKAMFTTKQGVTWDCILETREVHGVPVACQIPELFITKLCAVV